MDDELRRTYDLYLLNKEQAKQYQQTLANRKNQFAIDLQKKEEEYQK